MKRESELKSELLKYLKHFAPGFVVIRHEDVRTCGTPDLSITGLGRTTWWECKHATPTFSTTGIQNLVCLRLAAAGYCRYLIWWEAASGLGKRTIIATPKAVQERRGSSVVPEAVTPGFDHRWLVQQIQDVHRCR